MGVQVIRGLQKKKAKQFILCVYPMSYYTTWFFCKCGMHYLFYPGMRTHNYLLQCDQEVTYTKILVVTTVTFLQYPD
jgi:hypothetical protein